MVWNVDSPCSKTVPVVSFLTRREQVSFCTATWNTTVPALLAFKTFSTHQSHLSIPPLEWHGFSFFFFLPQKPHLPVCPAVISQQGNHHCRWRCCSFSSSIRYSFTLTAVMCFETLPFTSMRTSWQLLQTDQDRFRPDPYLLTFHNRQLI